FRIREGQGRRPPENIAPGFEEIFWAIFKGQFSATEPTKVGFARVCAEGMFTYSFVGTPETVTSELQGFLKMTRADELIVSNPIFDHAARLRSLELTALIRDSERSG